MIVLPKIASSYPLFRGRLYIKLGFVLGAGQDSTFRSQHFGVV